MATRRRTWGPAGHTPIVRYNYQHDRLSALAVLTVSAQRKHMGFYTRFQQSNFTARDVATFVRRLLRHLRGPVIVLWDGASIHKGPLFRTLQAHVPRLHLERFPAYAPELNPVEFVWKDFNGHTANSLLRDIPHLRQRLHTNTRRVSRTQQTLRSFIRASDLPSPPWEALHCVAETQ
jgi:transposase